MAAAELSQSAPARRLSPALRRSWPRACLAAWLSTLASALCVALAGGSAQAWIRRLLAARLDPALNPSPGLGDVLALVAHNLPIAAWPILLGVIGANRSARGRIAADGLVGAALIANTAPVGAALAAYGPRLFPYIPQLPLEWAALTLGTSTWLMQRRRPLQLAEGIALFALTAALVLIAAVLETVAVPHR